MASDESNPQMIEGLGLRGHRAERASTGGEGQPLAFWVL